MTLDEMRQATKKSYSAAIRAYGHGSTMLVSTMSVSALNFAVCARYALKCMAGMTDAQKAMEHYARTYIRDSWEDFASIAKASHDPDFLAKEASETSRACADMVADLRKRGCITDDTYTSMQRLNATMYDMAL